MQIEDLALKLYAHPTDMMPPYTLQVRIAMHDTCALHLRSCVAACVRRSARSAALSQGTDIASAPRLGASASDTPPETVWEVKRPLTAAAIGGIVVGVVLLLLLLSLSCYSCLKSRQRSARFRERQGLIYMQAAKKAASNRHVPPAPQTDRWADLDDDAPSTTSAATNRRDDDPDMPTGTGWPQQTSRREPREGAHGVITVQGQQYGQC